MSVSICIYIYPCRSATSTSWKSSNDKSRKHRTKKKDIVDIYVHIPIYIYIQRSFLLEIRWTLRIFAEKKKTQPGGEKGGARKGQLAGRIFDKKHLTSFANGADPAANFQTDLGISLIDLIVNWKKWSFRIPCLIGRNKVLTFNIVFYGPFGCKKPLDLKKG